MSTAAEVLLWGARIGTVALEGGERTASFEYDRGFLESGIELSPVAMPLAGRVYRFPELAAESFHGLPERQAAALGRTFLA